LIMSLEWGFFGASMGHISLQFVCMGLYVLCLLPVAFIADDLVRRDAPALLVYPGLLLVNLVLGCAVAFFTCRAYTLWYRIVLSNDYKGRWLFIGAGIHMSVYCSLGLLAFMNQRAADRVLEGVRRAELRRVRLDQQLVESRLATAEAQIDPKMLLGALGEIKRGFEGRAPDAEQNLNALIQSLRDALARTAAVSHHDE
jgi:hypothetical protein